MSRIAEESIQLIADATDIVELIGSYFPLKRAGTSFRALCPFHKEKSPSFHVNPSRQSFHCFGCGAGGGVFRFVMDYEHLDFPAAVRRLAQRAGIVLTEENDPQEQSRRNQRSRLLELHREAAAWFHAQLLRTREASHARDYLKHRGLTKEIAVPWQLGYAPAGWDHLREWAYGKGFTRDELLQGGLLTAKEGDQRGGYDRFRDRLMFPIRNDYGEVVAFSGRILSESQKEAKYVNSPETPISSKGRVLFGLDKSKRALIDAGEAIVLEGQIDLISAFEHGVTNVTAPQGTAFTVEQAVFTQVPLSERASGEGGPQEKSLLHEGDGTVLVPISALNAVVSPLNTSRSTVGLPMPVTVPVHEYCLNSQVVHTPRLVGGAVVPFGLAIQRP